MTAAPPKLSLCAITGNEAPHVVRFLDSFAPAFDELCLVRAVGNQAPDDTLDLAEKWCLDHGKAVRLDEYLNAGTIWPFRALGPGDEMPRPPLVEFDEANSASWPHVDDFAAARNRAWKLATGEWQWWADLDDVLTEGSAELIRAHVQEGKKDGFFFRYAIRTSLENVMRERLFRRGVVEWELPVHERASRYAPEVSGRKWDIGADPQVIVLHQPDAGKVRDPFRNIRIMQHALRHQNEFPWYLANEWFYQWQAAKIRRQPDKEAQARERFIYWAEVANKVHTLPEQRIQLYSNLAHVYGDTDLDRALDLAWEAIRVAPWRKEAWGLLAEFELAAQRADRAEVASELMMAFKKTPAGVIPATNRFSGWEGLTLRTRALRANQHEDKARATERAVFQKFGCRISLLHATRGRPVQAIETRANFFKAAMNPLGVEHIFAIDADDTASREQLAEYRHVIIEDPRGCVKAWNAAAAVAEGRILIQLSDDWLPCLEWDERIFAVMLAAAEKRGGVLETVPLVLAISDNHRTDALLCCAILSRARYRQQGFLFAPDYFGVFSDNEFTLRAYQEKIIVEAREIVFDHRHPIFEGQPPEQWDDTYRRQNAPERYAEGLEIFKRRNPSAHVA